MDIDKLFKVPKAPTGGNKRRMPDMPSTEVLKRMRLDEQGKSAPTNGGVSTNDTPPTAVVADKKWRATVTDTGGDDDPMDGDADGEFAPGGDADYFAEEDGEGRFFGGGLTDEQKQILSLIEGAQGEGVQDEAEELFSAATARRLLLRFERAHKKNTEQRGKYPDDPSRFIDSEADLDAAIKALLPLAQAPAVAYPELVSSGGATRLVELLSHENADIAIDVVEVIHELTDEDVGNEGDDDDEEQEAEGGRERALGLLVKALAEKALFELLVENLNRLNEAEEADRQGVFHVLGILENVLGVSPALGTDIVAKTKLLPWLLARIAAKAHDENRGYAAELLAILLQENSANRLEFGRNDGVDATLKVLSQFRKRDPANADVVEFMENVFDALCSALAEPANKRLFHQGEGVDLMVLLMKEKMQARPRSIKVLAHALSGPAGSANCETFVDALGLKTLFAALMGKAPKKGKAEAQPLPEDTAHVLDILSSLFSNLASGSPSRTRLLAKFVEAGYEKVERLLELREAAEARLKVAEHQIADEKKELLAQGEQVGAEEEDVWYVRRLDSGMFALQTIDYILAWICMEDDGIRVHVQTMLARKTRTLGDIVEVLKVYWDNITEEDAVVLDDNSEPAPSQRMILGELIAFLEAC